MICDSETFRRSYANQTVSVGLFLHVLRVLAYEYQEVHFSVSTHSVRICLNVACVGVLCLAIPGTR